MLTTSAYNGCLKQVLTRGAYNVRDRRIQRVLTIGAYNVVLTIGAFNVVLTMGAYNATFSMGAYHVGPVPYFNPFFR